MSANKVFEAVLRSRVLGQEALNVFFFRGTDLADVDATQISGAFIEQLYPPIALIAPDDVYFETLAVRDIFGTASPYITTIAEAGGAGSRDVMPPFNALSFVLNVATNLTRPGHKRFGGVYEVAQTDGIITDSGLITDLNDLAEQLATPLKDLTLGIVDWGIPIVVGRIFDNGNYRLPSSVGELIANVIVNAAVSLVVSSQISRKAPPGG